LSSLRERVATHAGASGNLPRRLEDLSEPLTGLLSDLISITIVVLDNR
jgi:hypothetical protein